MFLYVQESSLQCPSVVTLYDCWWPSKTSTFYNRLEIVLEKPTIELSSELPMFVSLSFYIILSYRIYVVIFVILDYS